MQTRGESIMVLYGITRRLPFWIFLGLLSIGGAYFSYTYFSRAFPIQNIAIKMDRNQALQKAQELASLYGWEPKNFQQAATFLGTKKLQNYVELELGGAQALAKVLEDPIISVYKWKIRHFAEFESHETQIFFKPDGSFYGFMLKLPETKEGPSLSPEKAKEVIEKELTTQWNVDLSAYELVESGKQELPSGRIDHLFTYELKDRKIGEAPIRLYTKLSGDVLTEFYYKVKVPQAFIRKYQEMRSRNELIANSASILGIGLLYGLICALLSFFFLVRRNMLAWKKSFLWGFIVSLLNVAAQLNNLPTLWLLYNNATSKLGFLFNLIFWQLISLVTSTIMIGFIFALAEGLTRWAFGQQPQFWRSWNSRAANSFQIAGRTLGGYLIIPIFMAYVIGFYWFALKELGWWSPSEILYDPNVIAEYFPWLGPVARSLKAGFLEECLFRAIPLASAIILGRWLGRERLILGAMFIAQCIIFSAAHATYAAQPAYARLVELIIPSIMFGLIYLFFGLLPGIICHYVYDLVWFALPLMLTETKSALLPQIIVIIAGMIPLLIVIANRLKNGSFRELPVLFYNQAWQQTENIVPHDPSFLTEHRAAPFRSSVGLSCLILLGSLAIFGYATRYKSDQAPITITTQAAADKAVTFMPKIDDMSSWVKLPVVELDRPHVAQNALQKHLFIWREGGKDLYDKLMNQYLLPLHWSVRFARFEGDVAERAEEYRVLLQGDGTPITTTHTLPEAREAVSLTESEAVKLALETIKNSFGLYAQDISLFSIRPIQKPNRLDWTLLYKVNTVEIPAQGQAIIRIRIAGNEIVFKKQFIFVPEEWRRNFQHSSLIEGIIQQVGSLALIALVILSILALLFYARFNSFSITAALIGAALMVAKSTVHIFNILPLFYASFITTHPWSDQLWTNVGGISLQILFRALLIALVIGLVQRIRFKAQRTDNTFITLLLQGFSWGTLLFALREVVLKFAPKVKPFWIANTVEHASSHIPWLSMLMIDSSTFLLNVPLTVITYVGLDYLTRGFLTRKWLVLIYGILYGLGTAATLFADAPYYLPIAATVFGLTLIIFYFTSRIHTITALAAASSYYIFSAIQIGILNPFPLGNFAGFLTAALYTLGTIIWAWTIYKQDKAVS